MNKFLLLALLTTVMFWSCNNSGGDSSQTADIIPDSVLNQQVPQVDKESMANIIENVSSPIEIAGLLLDEQVPFSTNYLCPTDQVSSLVTGFDCALHLGMLGTDLGYLNLYEKTGSVLSTVSAINDLANKLYVGQFFDFETIKRLALNSDNLDSLIFTSIESYNNMDNYLREHNQTNISTLIITGVWIESTHLLTQVYDSHKNPKIAERIGEQKLILNDLVLILANYKSDPDVGKLYSRLDDLKKIYDQVTITSTREESESYVEDGVLKIKQKATSSVDINDDIINQIRAKIEEIRNSLTQSVNA